MKHLGEYNTAVAHRQENNDLTGNILTSALRYIQQTPAIDWTLWSSSEMTVANNNNHWSITSGLHIAILNIHFNNVISENNEFKDFNLLKL